MIITEICAELRNWFVVPNGVHIQTYTISGGSIAPLDFCRKDNTSELSAPCSMMEFINTLRQTLLMRFSMVRSGRWLCLLA